MVMRGRCYPPAGDRCRDPRGRQNRIALERRSESRSGVRAPTRNWWLRETHRPGTVIRNHRLQEDDMEFGTIEREIYVEASPEIVFEVVSSPDHLKAWWP